MYFSNVSSPIATETSTAHNITVLMYFTCQFEMLAFLQLYCSLALFQRKPLCAINSLKNNKKDIFFYQASILHTHIHFWCFQPTAFPNISGETSRRKSRNGSVLLFSLKSCLLKNKTSFVLLKSNIQFRT